MEELRLKSNTLIARAQPRTCLIIALLVLLVTVFSKIALLGSIATIDADEGYSLISARFIQMGLKPYNDFFLAQTPLWFYLAATVWEVLGAGTPLAAWMMARYLSILAAVLTTLFVYLISRRLEGAGFGVLAVVLLSTSLTFCFYSFATTPEITSVLFATIAVFLSLTPQNSSSILLSGLFLGAGGMTKASALYLYPALLLSHAVQKRKPKALLTLTLSVLLPFIPLLGYDLRRVFSDLIVYRGTGSGYWAEYANVATYTFTRLELPLTAFGLTGIILLLSDHSWRRRALALYPVASIIGTVATPTPFAVHYFNFFAPLLAICGGALFAATWRRKLLIPVATIALLATFLVSARIGLSYYSYATDPRARANLLTAAEVVKSLTQPGEYVVGNHFAVFLADRRMPPPFVDTSAFMAHSGWLTDATLIETCKQYQVKLVLLHPDFDTTYPGFVRYVQQNYTLVQAIDDMSVYFKAA